MYHRISRSSAKTRPRRLLETAQGLVEYALILALVALLAVGATTMLGGQVGSTLSNLGGAVLGADQTGPPTPAPTPTGNPSDYRNATDCWAAGFFWQDDNRCHGSQGSPSDYDRSSSGCVSAGYFWYNGDCHSSAPSAGNINNSTDCWANHFYWQEDNDCHSSQGSPSDYDRTNNGSCQLAGYYWYGNDCHSDPQPPPPPPNGDHQVGGFCDPPGFDNDGSWEWVTTWNTSGTDHWDAVWHCDGSAR